MWHIIGNVPDAVVVTSQKCVAFLIRGIDQAVVFCPVSVLHEFCCCSHVLSLAVGFVWKNNHDFIQFSIWLLFSATAYSAYACHAL